MKQRAIPIAFTALLAAACGPHASSDPAADREAIAAVTNQIQAAENAGSAEQM